MNATVLVVEDDAKVRATLLFHLESAGFAVSAVGRAEAALALLVGEAAGPPPDLLLLDVRLPGMSGIELAGRLARAGRLPPAVVVSGEASMAETVEALRLGVHDFVEKPFSRERLLRSVANTLEHAALAQKVEALEARLSPHQAILGESPALVHLKEVIAKVAATGGRVLIRGESGTGKELVASAIHHLSARRAAPFVKVNCASLPAHLVEDELFGHARGAFTDAKVARSGLFEEAHGGTLFLDEIGDLELALQGRLLRVLEDGRVRRLGESRERQVDVRIVAATHRPLEAEVAAGRFRQDLYFRLAHLPVEVPPLRERPGDVPLLFAHFLARFADQYRLRRREIDPGLWPALAVYPWPGNVRELANVAERLAVFGGDPLSVDDLPSTLRDAAPAAPEAGLLRFPESFPVLPLKEWKGAAEREYLEAILRRTGWSFATAAKLLGVQRTHLHQRVTALGIERPKRAGRPAGGGEEGEPA
jgi:two-component system nitrogen regulation response regulator NtrX